MTRLFLLEYMQINSSLHVSFDVGHSSIGWAVMQEPSKQDMDPEILGCGSVIFGADDCLASHRRAFRRQRRHIRSTRQRIRNLKNYFVAQGVLTQTQLDAVAAWNPFQLAADVLANDRVLNWPEMWDVLRWYAHNRGYDGNRRWSAADDADQAADTEKVNNARGFMKQYETDTMAETMAAHVEKFEKEAAAFRASKKLAEAKDEDRPMRFKGLNAAFPRDVVEAECLQILEKHLGKLPSLTPEMMTIIMADASTSGLEKLPKRYQGGLLFGQMVPRFNNRIIANCPVSGEKVPSREWAEFYRFRWAMMLSNIRVGAMAERELRALTVEERQQLNQQMQVAGKLTPTELKKAVRTLPGVKRDNLETMLMHPDMKEALILDPAQDIISSEPVSIIWPHLSRQIQQRTKGQLRRGHGFTIGAVIEGNDAAMAALKDHFATKFAKNKKSAAPNLEAELAKTRDYKLLTMRAPYSREIMAKTYDFVLATNQHPKEKDGPLYITEGMRAAQVNTAIEDQTNNYLVRHRLKILAGDPQAKPQPKPGLLQDLIKAYAEDDPNRISRITIEVATEIRTMSGMSNKEKAKEMGSKLSNFKSVVDKLEQVLPRAQITGGLIRKARILEDMGWKCPYTDQPFDIVDLTVKGKLDKDHIIPYSLRESNSLDSLVVTYSEVNKMKDARLSYDFVKTCQGLRGMEAQERLRRWAEASGNIIPELDWLPLRLVSAATAEHEVRYRATDRRAVTSVPGQAPSVSCLD